MNYYAKNIEQRRVGCEIRGWDNVLSDLNQTIIDTDVDVGQLLSVELPDSGRTKFLKVRCSTGRDFVLPVSPDVTTAREANASTWGLSASEYNPSVQT